MNSCAQFKKPILICNLLAIAIGTIWLTSLCWKFSQTESVMLQKTAFAAATTGEQSRQQVRKDLWIVQSPHERIHDRIESEQSRLILRPKQNSIELIEQLQGVQGWIEEKSQNAAKNTPLQLRHFLAKEGVYFYKDQTFKAFNVLISLYKIQGNPLQWNQALHSPFLRGTAEALNFSLKGGIPVFQATQFSASLQGDSHP